MKPIKLIISAFGPYAEKMPEINFEPFENKGLFLITGDTGAGKTTIFDAVCFALYGETSGNYRDTKNLRSEYAKPQTESFVDFYFTHQGRQYHVYRKPSYDRAKQRGSGVINEKEKAEFYCEGETPIEGTSLVNNAVKELLRIDFKQFKQIAMIAQGEFWELLNASTEKRTEILRTIFMTSGYQKMENYLRERKNKSYAGRKTAEDSILQYFKEAEASEDSRLKENLFSLQEKAEKSGSTWNLEEMQDILSDIISEDKAGLKEKRKEVTAEEKIFEEKSAALHHAHSNNELIRRLAEYEKAREELETGREAIEKLEAAVKRQQAAVREVKPAHQTWKKDEEEVEEVRRQISEKKEEAASLAEKAVRTGAALSEAALKQPEAEALKKKAEKLKDDIEKYAKRDKLILSAAALEKEKGVLKAAEEALQEKENDLKEKIKKLDRTVKELKDCKSELVKVQSEGKRLVSLQKELENITEKALPEYQAVEKKLAEKQKNFEEMQREYHAVAEKRRNLETVLDHFRAGILARGLTKGSRCPVCGSTHHPYPASLPEETVSEEELKKLQEEEEDAKKRKEEALIDAEKTKSAREEKKEQLWIRMMDCMEEEYTGKKEEEMFSLVFRRLQEVKEQVISNAKQENSVQKDCVSYEKAEQELEKARGKETEELENIRKKHQEKKSVNQTALVETKTALKAFDGLEFADLKTAEREQSKADKEANQIFDAIEIAKTEKQKADQEKASMEAALRTLEKTKELQVKKAADSKKAFVKVLKARKFESEEEFLEFLVTEKEIADSDRKIRRYYQTAATNKEQLKQAKKDAKDKKEIDEKGLEEEVNSRKHYLEELRKRNSQTEHRIERNEKIKKNISAKQNTLEQLRVENERCRRLYDLISGNINNKAKVTFEQYIQAAGFDYIIAAANRRLLPMSDGQYELVRKEDSSDKKSKTILNLEVQDNFTGHRRPVGSLSGGESFKASLSLALGLSDTVSSNFGGVQMDALFVDEGFGTLDRKSIEGAMDILIRLSGTNKLVGIISHREELKENISQQIRVKKTKHGSEIEIDDGI